MAPSSIATSPATLSAPVGRFMRPTLTCPAEDSVERAIGELRRNGGTLPIVQDDRIIGILNESSLLRVLSKGVDRLEPCTRAMSEAPTIAPYGSGAEALRRLSEMEIPTLVVVDDSGRVMGLISPSDLFPRRRSPARPAQVGGMATPFGVYLTNGNLHGGVSLFAVMATGAMMFAMMVVSVVIAALVHTPIEDVAMPTEWRDLVQKLVTVAVFLALMRLLPLSGTHGAEHMVVHAVERGEELTPEVVARMPRVHPRCGTNIAVAVTLFGSIATYPWVSDESTRLLVAAFATLFLWKPLGSFVQQYVTTKKPTESQIRSGIKAATELIEKHSTARFSVASIPKRVWNSGLLHVLAGSTLLMLTLQGVMKLFHFSLPGLE